MKTVEEFNGPKATPETTKEVVSLLYDLREVGRSFTFGKFGKVRRPGEPEFYVVEWHGPGADQSSELRVHGQDLDELAEFFSLLADGRRKKK